MSNVYKPYGDRHADFQYQKLLHQILENGVRAKSQQGVDALTILGPEPLRFNLSNGFPIITERDIKSFWKQAVGEICAFVNGARTQAELEKFGCKWWRSWVSKEKCEKRGLKEGDLGPGSYGAAFHDFPTAEGSPFNQFSHIVEQIKELPHLRTHFISPWIPQYTGRGKNKNQKVVVAPCHGWIHIRIIENKLSLVMFQRSADVPVGVPANMIQYAALTLMISRITGYEPHQFIHMMSDAHIYVDQIPQVKQIISRSPKPFPTVSMDQTVNNLFDFRPDHFALSDYNPYPAIKDIPVAV